MYLSKRITSLGLLTSGLLVAAINASAADISHSLRNKAPEPHETANYFELGVGVAAGVAPSLTKEDDDWQGAYLVINGSYTWKDFFIEKYGESRDPILLGYNAYTSTDWSVDVVIGPKYAGLPSDNRFDGLDKRNSSTMFGIRTTGYIGDYTVQFSAKQDISGNDTGFEASALVGRNWQYRNWNFHGMAGIQYHDANFNQYYYGISEAEADRTQFDYYQPKDSIFATVEAGVTYPISENWVFRGTAWVRTVADEVTDSPLFLNKRSNALGLSTSISYVF
ncbi:MipA/OmpV family protein [Thalassotalea fusca]